MDMDGHEWTWMDADGRGWTRMDADEDGGADEEGDAGGVRKREQAPALQTLRESGGGVLFGKPKG